MKFKVGDWVVSDYEIKQIQEMENGVVTGVSCGNFSTSGSNITCYPLTLQTKRIAEFIKYHDRKLHENHGHSGLNFPDIHGRFVEFFWEACDASMEKNDEAVRKVCEKVSAFYDNIVGFVSNAKTTTVDGVRLMR